MTSQGTVRTIVLWHFLGRVGNARGKVDTLLVPTRLVVAVLFVCVSLGGDLSEPARAPGGAIPKAVVVVSLPRSSTYRGTWLEAAVLGGRLRRLTKPLAGSRVWGPALSPDGRRVAFIRGTRRSAAVYVVRVDGGAPRRLMNLRPPGFYNVPPLTWTADGSSVVTDRFSGVECQTKKPFRLRFTMARLGGGSRDVDVFPRPRRGVYLQEVSSSPDGRRFSLIVIDHGPKTCDGHAGDFETLLYTIRSDGKGLTLLARADAISDSEWSYDGRWLVYMVFDPFGVGGCYFVVVAADGSQKRRLLTDPDCNGQVAWQPHRLAIAFAGDQLKLVDAASGRAQTLLPSSVAFPGRDSFSRDGQWLAVITDSRADKKTLMRIALIPMAGGTPVTYDVRRQSPPWSWSEGDLIFP
jgi:dipeptidyl aminopeptidase/acylaminoacyl peptidase